MSLEDEDKIETNRGIFDFRVESMVRHIEETIKRKKKIAEEAKEESKKDASKKRSHGPYKN